MNPRLPRFPFFAVLLAVAIVPTNLAFIRATYLPSFVPPSFVISSMLIIMICCKFLHRPVAMARDVRELFIFCTILGMIMLVSLTFTKDLEFGMVKFTEYVTITSFACIAAAVILKDSSEVQGFLFSLIVIGFGLAGLVLLVGPFSDSREFATPFGGNYLAVQHMAGMGCIVVLYHCLLTVRRFLAALLWLGVFLLLVAALVYVGGKGAVLALLATTCLMALLTIRYKLPVRIRIVSWRILSYPLLLVVFCCAGLAYFMATDGFSAFLERMSFILTPGHDDQVERVENLAVAIDLFRRDPILGSGLGTFASYGVPVDKLGADEIMKYPHNIFAEALSELGLLGTLVLFFVITLPIVRLFQLKRLFPHEHLPDVFLALLVFALLNALTSQYIANPALFGLLGAPYGLKQLLVRDSRYRRTLDLSVAGH